MESSISSSILTDFPFRLLNDYCWLEIVKYLPVVDGVKYERVCRKWKAITERHWYELSAVPPETDLLRGRSYPLPYHIVSLKLPNLAHVKFFNNIVINAKFGKQLAKKCPAIRKFSGLATPADFETVFNYVRSIGIINQVTELEISARGQADVIVLVLEELVKKCPKLTRLSFKKLLLTKYLPFGVSVKASLLGTELTHLRIENNDDLYALLSEQLNPKIEEFHYIPTVTNV